MTRILVPVDEDQGRDSIPNAKFGSSPYYLLVHPENPDEDRLVKNTSKKFGGDISPISFILNQEPTTIFTTHACQNALNHINKAEITPYLVDHEPVATLLSKFDEGQLAVMTEADH